MTGKWRVYLVSKNALFGHAWIIEDSAGDYRGHRFTQHDAMTDARRMAITESEVEALEAAWLAPAAKVGGQR